jgi:N-acetylglucosamine malate deacetylase 2
MNIVYIFPHPDDESFGPAGVIDSQVKQGHRVHLLTLTKGGATQQRHKLGLSVEEMGQLRYQEMLRVKESLSIDQMIVLDYPDSALSELDPRVLEREVQAFIDKIKPNIVITYPVHGGSGYHDHLVTHAVVKRVFLDMRESGHSYLKRLAFFTMPDSGEPTFLPSGWPRLKLTDTALIDAVIPLQAENIQAMKDALLCYQSYQAIVETTGVIEKIGNKVHFEIFGEQYSPPLISLTQGLELD